MNNCKNYTQKPNTCEYLFVKRICCYFKIDHQLETHAKNWGHLHFKRIIDGIKQRENFSFQITFLSIFYNSDYSIFIGDYFFELISNSNWYFFLVKKNIHALFKSMWWQIRIQLNFGHLAT